MVLGPLIITSYCHTKSVVSTGKFCPCHQSQIDHPHRVLTDRTAQRVNVSDPQNQVAPSFGGKSQRRQRVNAGAADHQLQRQAALTDTRPPKLVNALSFQVESLNLKTCCQQVKFGCDGKIVNLIRGEASLELGVQSFRQP